MPEGAEGGTRGSASAIAQAIAGWQRANTMPTRRNQAAFPIVLRTTVRTGSLAHAAQAPAGTSDPRLAESRATPAGA